MTLARHLALSVLFFSLAANAQDRGEETIKDPKPNTAEGTIAAALEAGLAGDFDAYLETIHPEHKATTEQRSQRQKYEWARFEKQAAWYVVSQKPMTFVIARRQPDGDNYLKVFLKDQKNKERMPVPVQLKKDGAGWKIVTSSL